MKQAKWVVVSQLSRKARYLDAAGKCLKETGSNEPELQARIRGLVPRYGLDSSCWDDGLAGWSLVTRELAQRFELSDQVSIPAQPRLLLTHGIRHGASGPGEQARRGEGGALSLTEARPPPRGRSLSC